MCKLSAGIWLPADWYNLVYLYQKEPDGSYKVTLKIKVTLGDKNALVTDAAQGCAKSYITVSHQNIQISLFLVNPEKLQVTALNAKYL